MDELQIKLLQIEHGFKPFAQEARTIVDSHSLMDAKKIAINLLNSDFYQIRACAVFILGFIADKDRSVLFVLKGLAREDKSWQIQEIIAKAFDQFCHDNGYENSLKEIMEWINDENPNVCRVVTEGLRIWTSRPYFKDNPKEAIQLISLHKSSDSEYLRKSVGNALRDICKKNSNLIENEISKWNLDDSKTAFTYHYVIKRH